MFSAMTTGRLAQAATLANTAPGFRGGRSLPERLDTTAALPTALPGVGFDGATASSATLRFVRKLRSAIAGIWQDAAAEDIDAALEGINQLLSTAGPVRVVPPSESAAASDAGASPTAAGAPRHGAGTPASATDPRTPAVLAAGHEDDAPEKTLSISLALALAEVALAGELTRLRTCAGEDCTNAFVDLTRNRSKQFCDEANCANRAHVKAYRARRAAELGESGEEGVSGESGQAEAAGHAGPPGASAPATDDTSEKDSPDEKADRADKKEKHRKKKLKKAKKK
jgi:CGNR zinc finger